MDSTTSLAARLKTGCPPTVAGEQMAETCAARTAPTRGAAASSAAPIEGASAAPAANVRVSQSPAPAAGLKMPPDT